MAQSQTPLPFTSLNAATATGPGTSKDLEGVYGTHTIAASVTGSPDMALINLTGGTAPTVTVTIASA